MIFPEIIVLLLTVLEYFQGRFDPLQGKKGNGLLQFGLESGHLLFSGRIQVPLKNFDLFIEEFYFLPGFKLFSEVLEQEFVQAFLGFVQVGSGPGKVIFQDFGRGIFEFLADGEEGFALVFILGQGDLLHDYGPELREAQEVALTGLEGLLKKTDDEAKDDAGQNDYQRKKPAVGYLNFEGNTDGFIKAGRNQKNAAGEGPGLVKLAEGKSQSHLLVLAEAGRIGWLDREYPGHLNSGLVQKNLLTKGF